MVNKSVALLIKLKEEAVVNSIPLWSSYFGPKR
jgi:hypothetical protein